VDFEKAFDTISRNALLHKLKIYGMSLQTLQRLEKIYTRVDFCVRNGQNKISEPIPSYRLTTGVPTFSHIF